MPFHPGTLRKIELSLKGVSFKNIEFLEPLSYFDSIRTIHNSKTGYYRFGGVQKEAYMLKKKCITVRSETEWVETTKNNWNSLVFDDIGRDIAHCRRLHGRIHRGSLWKGELQPRILSEFLTR